jgi:hypothetical protein
MTNEIKPQQHVDITNFESVDATSKGTVRRATWSPSLGYAREQAINEARVQAMEEHVLQETERNAVFETRRFLMLEGAVADLQARLKALEGK